MDSIRGTEVPRLSSRSRPGDFEANKTDTNATSNSCRNQSNDNRPTSSDANIRKDTIAMAYRR